MRPKSTCARKKMVKVPTLVYKGCGNGKSFCFELVANKAALIEEERSISARVPVSLFVLLELSGDNFIFTDNCNIEEIPGDTRDTREPVAAEPRESVPEHVRGLRG